MPLSPYVAGMRELIGDKELLIPTVTVLVVDDDGRLLLGRPVGVGWWCTIGGMVEPGESPQEAAHREAEEEIGSAIELGPMIHGYGGDDYRFAYGNGHRVACVGVVFEARALGPVAPDGEELEALGWYGPDELAGIELNRFNQALLSTLGWR